MNKKPFINKKVAPMSMLDGRASFAYVNGIAIVISNVDKWDDATVLKFIEEQADLCDRQSAIGNVTHFFGEIFGAHHRKLIVEWIEKNNLVASSKTALVTDSAIMRGALTAYSWLTKTEAKAYDRKSSAAMCEWITEGTSVNSDEVKLALESCYKLVGK